MENLSHDEIISEINENLPKWIISIAKDYDINYPHFKKNWNLICKKYNTTPKYIIIVNHIPHTKDAQANLKIIKFCSELTKLGYIIRREQELMISKNGKVIPTKYMYNYLCKSPNLRQFMPKIWTDS